jgi:integrase
MSRPVPKIRGGRWYLDLRWAGGGQYTLQTPGAPEFAADAIHESYAKLEALRAELAAHPQLKLPIGGAPPIAEVIRLFTPEKERHRKRKGSAAYVRQYLRAIDRRLGKSRVSVFEGTHGTRLLLDHRNLLADEGLGPKSRNNYLTLLMEVLRFAQERGWLLALPTKPDATIGDENLNNPEWRWYTEGDFRRLRAGLYVNPAPRARLKAHIPDPAKREDFIARKRLYLSVGFYTGMHTADLDKLTDEHFSVGTGHFLRVNTKSSRAVPPKMLRMPEPLWLDIKEEIRRLGRPWFRGELVAGGPWHMPTKEPNRAAVRLQLPPWTYRIARRSTAHHLCLLGWSERDVAEYLGHVDQQMIRAVYARVPIDQRAPEKQEWTGAAMKRWLGGITDMGKVIRFGPHAAPAPWSRKRKGNEHG